MRLDILFVLFCLIFLSFPDWYFVLIFWVGKKMASVERFFLVIVRIRSVVVFFFLVSWYELDSVREGWRRWNLSLIFWNIWSTDESFQIQKSRWRWKSPFVWNSAFEGRLMSSLVIWRANDGSLQSACSYVQSKSTRVQLLSTPLAILEE